MKALPTVAGVDIPVDEHGRFNLNTLHRASRTPDHKKPSVWLKNPKTAELIQELTGQSQPDDFGIIETIRGGNAPGTFAHELLAISYAGWVSPAFQLQVNQTFIDYRTGKLQSRAQAINWDDPRELAGLVQQGAQKVIELKEQIAVLEPQAKAFDRIGGLDGSICLRDAGKKLQLQRCDDIFSILERAHWIYRRTGNRQWTAFQGKIRSGYLEHKVTTRVLPDGNERIDTQVRMTGKGLAKLSEMIEAPMQEELL